MLNNVVYQVIYSLICQFYNFLDLIETMTKCRVIVDPIFNLVIDLELKCKGVFFFFTNVPKCKIVFVMRPIARIKHI